MAGIRLGAPVEPLVIGDGPGVGARSGRAGAVQHDDAAHGRQGTGHLRQRGQVIGVDHQDGRGGVIDDGRHLGGRQAPVHRHVDGTEQRPAEEHVEIGQAVPVEQGHPVTRHQPVAPARLGHPAGPPVLLRPRAPDLARHQHLVVRPGPGQPPHQAGDRESVRWNHVSWGRGHEPLSRVGEAGVAPFSDLDPTGGGVPGA